jgi:hypothetical protein
MTSLSVRRAFALFHATLGLIVFLQSVGALRRALVAHGGAQTHIMVLAGAEALAAILFLIPKTRDIGGTVLLIIFAVAVVLHGFRGQLPLFVYAAGVILVIVHGSTFSRELFRFRSDST